MRVHVKLFAHLRHYLPAAEPGVATAVALPAGATVGDLADRLGLPREEARVVFVNGRARALDWPLEPGDEVGMFPPIGGG